MLQETYDSIEYPMYKDFKHLQATWLDQERTIFDLTTSEINNLIAIADSSRGTAGAQARGILLFAYDSLYSYSTCPQLPDTSLKSAELKGNTVMNENGGNLTVSAKPNPARNSVTFSYVLPAGIDKAVLKIFSTNGKLVYTRILSRNSEEFIYNCSHLKRGVYYYFVSANNEKVSGKLIIIR